MIITIEGHRAEGKSTLAKSIYGCKKTSFIQESSLGSSFWASSLDSCTEVIVVDDVKDYKNTCNFFKNETIIINERFGNSFDIKTPMVILIKQ